MAVDLNTTYPDTDGPDAGYPEGKFKNVTTPSSTDGTPFEKAWPNDIYGYLQRKLTEAGTPADNAPDTVLDSQYHDADMIVLIREMGDKGIRSFDLVSDMVAATDLNVGDLVITRGYLAAGVGSAIYRVVASATGTPDGGEFINLNTHQAQLIPGPVVTSSQYGAVGDGSTDDSTEIQALIDAFQNIRIDTNSKVDTTLSIGDQINMVIAQNIIGGATATTILQVVTAGLIGRITFEGDGKITGDGATAAQVGIGLLNTGLIHVIKPYITGCLGKGINISNSSQCVIEGGFIMNTTTTAGIYIGTSATAAHNHIINCNVSDNVVGLMIDAGVHNRVDGLLADDCTDAGVKLEGGASFNLITGAQCDDSTNAAGAGIHIDGESNDNTLINPVCRSNAGHGILIEGTGVGNETARNRIFGALCNTNGADGISMLLGLDNEIHGATCRSNTANGIHTEDCNRPKIIGGLVGGNGTNGILHDSSLNTHELNVTVVNNTGRGIYITDNGSLTPERFQSHGCHFEDNTGADWDTTGGLTLFARAIHSTGDFVDKMSDNELNVSDGTNINHACSITPTAIVANTDSPGIVVSITVITSTQFTVRLYDVSTGAAAVGTYTVYWQAHCFNGQ